MPKSVEAQARPSHKQVVERLSQLGRIDINTQIRLLNPGYGQSSPPDAYVMPSADESTEPQYGRLANFVLSRPVQVGVRAATIVGTLVGAGIAVDLISDNDNTTAFAANLEAPDSQQPSPTPIFRPGEPTPTKQPTVVGPTPANPTPTREPHATAIKLPPTPANPTPTVELHATATPPPTSTEVPTVAPTQPPQVFVTPGLAQQIIDVCERDVRGVLTGIRRIQQFVNGILQSDQRIPAPECLPQQVQVPVPGPEVPGPERVVERQVPGPERVVPGPTQIVERVVQREVPGPERVVEREVPGPTQVVEREVTPVPVPTAPRPAAKGPPTGQDDMNVDGLILGGSLVAAAIVSLRKLAQRQTARK